MSGKQVRGWDLPSVNRSALVVEAAEASLAWARQCPDCDEDAVVNSIREEGTIYLIPEQEGTPERWLKRNYYAIFEHELWAWCSAPTYWPSDRSFTAFQQFFAIRFDSVVVDTTRSAIDPYTH